MVDVRTGWRVVNDDFDSLFFKIVPIKSGKWRTAKTNFTIRFYPLTLSNKVFAYH
jgi:hypothetical protein